MIARSVLLFIFLASSSIVSSSSDSMGGSVEGRGGGGGDDTATGGAGAFLFTFFDARFPSVRDKVIFFSDLVTFPFKSCPCDSKSFFVTLKDEDGNNREVDLEETIDCLDVKVWESGDFILFLVNDLTSSSLSRSSSVSSQMTDSLGWHLKGCFLSLSLLYRCIRWHSWLIRLTEGCCWDGLSIEEELDEEDRLPGARREGKEWYDTKQEDDTREEIPEEDPSSSKSASPSSSWICLHFSWLQWDWGWCWWQLWFPDELRCEEPGVTCTGLDWLILLPSPSRFRLWSLSKEEEIDCKLTEVDGLTGEGGRGAILFLWNEVPLRVFMLEADEVDISETFLWSPVEWLWW